MASKTTVEIASQTEEKEHPLRLCPKGYHYVRTHQLHVPPSREHPEGQVVTRHA